MCCTQSFDLWSVSKHDSCMALNKFANDGRTSYRVPKSSTMLTTALFLIFIPTWSGGHAKKTSFGMICPQLLYTTMPHILLDITMHS